MAVDIPLLTRRRVFAAEIETTTGSPTALAAGDAAFNAFNPSIEPDIAFNRREGQGVSVDPIVGIPGARGANVSVETDVYGAATVPSWGTLLLGAGATLSSRTYSFTTTTMNDATLTMGFYQDGRLRQASGCKLNMRMSQRAGNHAMCAWTGTGLWQPTTAVALLAPTYPTTKPPRGAATLTIGGVAFKISNWELDLGNEIQYREDDADTTGYHSACIVNRNITFTCDPEEVAFATQDWDAAYLAGTEYALSLVIGATTDNIITISAPKMQLNAAPVPGDRNGILIANLSFQCNRSVAAGDDSLTIVFS